MKMLKIDDQISIKRSVDNGTEEQRAIVKNIIESVRKNGDQALKEYTEKFDGISLDGLKVPLAEIEEALSQVDGKILEIIKEAAENIRSFHEKQLRPSWMTTEENGTVLGQKITPLDS
ncbi:histidinol dehydrogenase, partial [Vibrio vulnificus]